MKTNDGLPESAALIGRFDVSDIVRFIEADPKIWEYSKFRQSLQGLGETESILICYNEADPGSREGSEYQYSRAIAERLQPATDYIKHLTGRNRVVRQMVAKVLPGGRIRMHADLLDQSNSQRFHWVLKTNDQCRMLFRRTKLHFAEGEIWIYNNRGVHGVANDGDTDRIHMIVDLE
jgi:hypothetical protein